MLALGTDSDRHEQLAKRRRYRWGYGGSILAGVLGLFAASSFGYPLVGIGIYWLGVLAMVAVAWRSPMQLFDEREQRHEQRAAALTLGIVTILGVITLPGLVALEEASVLTIPTWVQGVFVGYVLLFTIFAIVFVGTALRK